MADVARLGLIVDATGAKREIRLTTDELRKLADGGKLATSSLKQVGAPETVQRLNLVTTATRRMNTEARATEVGLKRIREPLTQLAVAASGVPGPLGRVASALAPLALGGGVTVGVLAGIAALGFAWRQFTAEADKAREAMEKVRAGWTQFSGAALQARSAALGRQESSLKRQLDTELESGGGILGLDIDLVKIRRLNRELAETRRLRAELGATSANEVRDTAIKGLAPITVVGQRTRPAGATPRGDMDPLAFIRKLEQERKDAAKRVADAEEQAAEDARRAWEQAHYQRMQEIQEIINKIHMVAGAAMQGLGAIASRNAGNIGGVLAGTASGVIGGAMAGGPFGAVVGGITSFVGGLLGMNSAVRENRKQIEAERAAREKLNAQLETAVRNAPRGFFLESYFRGAVGAGPPDNPNGPPTTKPGTLTLVLAAGSIVVNGNRSDIEMARGVVRGIRQLASANGGTGMQIADAMERIN